MKTYLFDFDGTLVDSMPLYASFILRLLDENKVPHEDDIVKTITPLGMMSTVEYLIGIGLALSKEEVIRLMQEYFLDAYFYKIPAKENVLPTLKELKDRGASLNVLTASPHITLDACLKRLGIYDWFDHVWSCDDFGTSKADPEIYKMAAKQTGERVEDVLFLDDNLNAVLTAKEAGMKVCGVYDASSGEYEGEIRAAADFYVRDFSELLSL